MDGKIPKDVLVWPSAACFRSLPTFTSSGSFDRRPHSLTFWEHVASSYFLQNIKNWWSEEVYARWVGLKLQTKLRISNPTWKSGIEILSATLNTKKEQLLQRIQLINTEEEKGRISDMQRVERIKAKDKFQEVALPEEIKWRQKSRINWLRHGDCNAKFFHTFANGRRSKSKSLLLLLMVPKPTTFKGLKMRLLPSTSTFVLLW